MMISNPVFRLMLKALSAFGLLGNQRDSATRRGNRIDQRDCPFVLVARAAGGRWGVFQQDFDRPQAVFDDMQEACDYANELARTRIGSIVLMGKSRGATANPGSSIAEGTT